ncbi:MAG: HAD family phosphatase [Lachnospiraceae bacterium]|nr:HAD family phosphatase [Lachnospiraceae bacterium]
MTTSSVQIPKLAIFDMDGILFNTEELFMHINSKYLKQYGYSPSKENYVKTLGTKGETLTKILKEMYGNDYPEQEISDLSHQSMNQYVEEHGLEIKPGIPDLLKFLKENGTICMVASSTRYETVNRYLEMTGLKQFFSNVIGGDMVVNSKPNPEIFLKAFESHKDYMSCISYDEAVIIEDSENGILAGHAAGIPVICIPDLVYPNPDIAKIPIAILHSADDVIKFYSK